VETLTQLILLQGVDVSHTIG